MLFIKIPAVGLIAIKIIIANFSVSLEGMKMTVAQVLCSFVAIACLMAHSKALYIEKSDQTSKYELIVRTGRDSLMIDTQNIVYNPNNDTFNMSVKYYGHCKYFLVEIFSYEEINQSSKTPLFEPMHYPTSASSVVIEAVDLELEASEPNFFRITAIENGDTCSDARSRGTFYRFFQRVNIKEVKRYSSIKIPIPKIRPDCTHSFLMEWPQSKNKSKNCYCHPVEHEFSLESCAHMCGSEIEVEVETVYQNFIFFQNISFGNFLIHFVCENRFCDEPDCHQENFVTSYYITIDSQSDNMNFSRKLELSTIEAVLSFGIPSLLVVIEFIVIIILCCILCFKCRKKI